MGIVLFPKQSLSAPSITSVSGTINEGQAVTITGSGFGVKNPAAPYIWANFDDGSPQPSALGQIRSWSVLNFTPTTGVGVRGTVGLQSHLWTLGGPNDNFSALVGNKPSGFSWGDYNQTWYVFRKSKRNFAVTDDMNWKNLRFWYANGSLYTQLGNGNISEEGLGLASWMCGWHSPPTAGCKDGISIEQIRGYSDGRWNTEQFIARAQSGAGREDGSFEYVVNGRKAAVVPYFDYNQKVFAMAQGAPGDAWYVHDQSANDPDPPSGSRTWADNIYVDRTWARVMLSNRSTWGTASTGPLYEIQIPTAWSASNITIQVNRGELTNGTVYLYVIDSNNSANATGYPVTLADGGGDTTPPTSPTNLAATSPSQSSISVSWTASTDAVGVTGYIVERCQGSGCSNFTQVGTPTASPFVDSGLTANTFYNYHVRARDAANNLSGWSNVVGATTQSASSGTPTISSVSGTVSNGNTITISGSGFGTKAQAGPMLWDDFDSGTNGSIVANDGGGTTPLIHQGNLSSYSQWQVNGGGAYASKSITFNNASPKSRSSLHARANFTDSSYWGLNLYVPYTQFTTGNPLYISFYYRMTKTGANFPRQSKALIFYDSSWQDMLYFSTGYNSCEPTNYYRQHVTQISTDYGMNVGGVDINAEWVRFENYLVQSGANQANGHWATTIYQPTTGAIDTQVLANQVLRTGSTNPSRITLGGAYYDMCDSDPGSIDVDDVYIDSTPARIEICDTSTWSGRNKCEVQLSTVWGTGTISATVKQGYLSNGSAYLYVIDGAGAVNTTGYPITIGSGGGDDTTPPTSPTNLAATSPSQSSISVSWTASTDAVGVTGYIVERCQGSGCSNFTQIGTPTASPFVDSGLTANTFYNYHVRARDAANNLSGWSNVVGATTQANTPVTELIIDNTDTNTSQSGSWSPSTNFPGYYGTDYHYSPNATGHWFEWTATNLVAGTYEVYAYWNANTDRPTDVSYLITHSGGTATRNNINQTQNGSQWNLLGTYTFGTTGTVRVQSGGTGTEGTVADAIRFLKTNTTPCNTVTTSNFSQAAYNSYGAPFDAFQTSTNLMNTTCTSADTHTINLTTGVTGDTTRIIYTKGYWYDAVTAGWKQYTGTCTGALNGEWCQGSVSATITDPNVSTASAANPTYLVGMTCSVQGGSWKCGCRDTTCANFSWQIQGAGM